MQKYVAPADGARSGLGGAEIRIGTPGKRATTGRERGAPVRKARILGSMGGGGGGGGFLRARSGAGRGDWHTGKRAEERQRRGFGSILASF